MHRFVWAATTHSNTTKSKTIIIDIERLESNILELQVNFYISKMWNLPAIQLMGSLRSPRRSPETPRRSPAKESHAFRTFLRVKASEWHTPYVEGATIMAPPYGVAAI